jgi:hypothetical protein
MVGLARISAGWTVICYIFPDMMARTNSENFGALNCRAYLTGFTIIEWVFGVFERFMQLTESVWISCEGPS